MTVWAPTSFQSGKVEPYISLAELLGSATAAAVDFQHLIAGGTDDQQTAAVTELIWRASAIADLYTLGTVNNVPGTLNATYNPEGQWFRPTRDGIIIIHPAFKPIIGLSAFSYGWGPGNNQINIPISQDNVIFDEEQFEISQWGPAGVQFGGLSQLFGGGPGTRRRIWAQYTYLNGFFNSFLTADCESGASELQVSDYVGAQPGMFAMMWDAQYDEQLQIDPDYDGQSLTIPLLTPTTFSHVAGTNFSAIPLAVKQAAIHLTGQPGGMAAPKDSVSYEDYGMAFDLLDDFKPTWGKL
jgi:hypothetical protein